jgi:alpha-tubulin suppressor-like RCC1 family protein
MSWGYPVDGRLGYGYSSSELQQQQHQGTVMDGSAEEEEAVAACVWQPKQVSRLSGVKIVGASCGADHTVVVTEWGAAFSFGDDSMNQLGTGRDSLHSSGLSGPMGLYSAENSNSQMVHLSEEYAGGGIGFQRVDSLGSNATDVIHSVLFPNPVKVEKLVSGYAHTLALVQQCRSANPNWNNPNSKGEEAKGGDMVMFDEVNCVYSWGWDSADQLGHGGFEGVGLPAYVQGFQGDYFSPRGEGEGGDGQSEDATSTTAPIMNLMDPVMIGAGRVHSVVLTRDNSLYTWGSSSNGRLGQYLFQKDGMQQMQQATTAMPQKVHIPEELNVNEIVDIKCGFDHTLLLVK